MKRQGKQSVVQKFLHHASTTDRPENKCEHKEDTNVIVKQRDLIDIRNTSTKFYQQEKRSRQKLPPSSCGKCLLQLWEMIWKFLKGLKIELLFDPTVSVLGVRHLLATVPVYPPSSQHYPPELRRGHGDYHWWMDKKATVMCIVILYMEIQTFATAWSNLEDIIWH